MDILVLVFLVGVALLVAGVMALGHLIALTGIIVMIAAGVFYLLPRFRSRV